MRHIVGALGLALCLCAPIAAQDWSEHTVTARRGGAPVPASVKQLTGERVRLTLGGEAFELDGRSDRWLGMSKAGLVGALAGERGAWSIDLARAPSEDGRVVFAGELVRGSRTGGETREALTVTLAPPVSRQVPEHLLLEPTDVGASEEELVRDLERRRPDELTVVFLNVGKGEHVDHVPAVNVGGVDVDPLNANLRFLADLRPDFLVLAEVSKGLGERTPTLDAGTQAVLREAFPGQLLVPSIWEFQQTNNNAIYSRYRLSHVGGETRTQTGAGITSELWSREGAPASEEHARVTTRWLDWTPPGATAEEAARFRAAWGDNNYNTRAHTEVEFVLGGRACVLLPVHFAMPWLEVSRTAVRDGFLVDGLQHHQLHERGPLYHQIARAREHYGRLPHGRVVLIGDTNIARHPKAAIQPLKISPEARGDGAPARDTALAFELLAEGFYDAFAGDDDTWTWPNPAGADERVHVLPRQRIDNCLHGAGFEVVQRSVFFPRGADHGGVLVRLRVRDDAGGPPPTPRRRPPLRPVDTTEPLLEVRSPARGALTDSGTVIVEGQVSDDSGVRSLVIDGAEVAVGPGGAFSHEVALDEGLNLIRLEAADGAGNRTRSVRSIARGRLLPAARAVDSAAVVRLGLPAFAWAEAGADARLAGLDLEAALLAQNPLVDRRWSSLTVLARARRASFGSPSVRLQPTAGALRVAVDLPRVRVDLSVVGDLRYGPTLRLGAKVTARRARLTAWAAPTVREGVIVTALRDVQVRFEGFHVDVRHLPNFVDRFISQQVRGVVAAELRKQVEAQVPPQIDRLLQVVSRPLTHEVAGRAVALTLVPEGVAFDAGGATVRLGANVTSSAQGVSLGTAGTAPRLGGSRAVAVALDDDLLNRVAHAAWTAGLLEQRITTRGALALGAPAWAPNLTAGVLAPMFPDALAGIDPSAPLALTLRPSAAPLLRPEAGGVMLALGDLRVDLAALPAGEASRTVLRVAVTCFARLRVSVSDEGLLSFALEGSPRVYTDVVEGGPGLLGRGVEAILNELLPAGLEKLVGGLSGVALPLPAGLGPRNVSVGVAGPARDRLLLSADLPSPGEALFRGVGRALGIPLRR